MSGFIGVGIGPYPIGRTGTPADPVPVAGAELVVNGGFDSDTWWTKGSGWSISGGVAIASSGADIYRVGLLDRYKYYRFSFDVVSVSAGTITLLSASYTPSAIARSNPGSYSVVGRTVSADTSIYMSGGGAFSGSIDNVSVIPLTLSSLLSTRTYASADCDLSAAVTRTAGTQAGLVARLDSSTSPANFIIAYLDGASNVKADKCVAGTYTNVISGAVTYGSTKRLRLVCSGTSVSAYYDGTQVGSTVTVSDAGIVSNTRHGLFSTYASNAFAGYVAA